LVISAVAGALPLVPEKTGILDFVAFGMAGVAASALVFVAQIEMISVVETTQRGSGAGIFESSVGIGVALGPIIAGVFAGSSLAIPFVIAPISFVFSIPVLLVLLRLRS